MATVRIGNQYNFEKQLARFNQLCLKEHIVRDCKRGDHFETSRDERKRRQAACDKRNSKSKNARKDNYED